MREILFRGKCIQGKEWVYGYFFAKPILEKYFIELGNEMWQVDPTTVGQYTGLQDMNGNKIFEGDIVNFLWIDKTKIAVVGFDDGAFYLEWMSKLDKNKGFGTHFPAPVDNVQIIGNVHDNPELLEVK